MPPEERREDEPPRVEMVAQHLCPICGERATLRCANCERYVCADHVARGFALGYVFVCVDCIAEAQAASAQDGG